MRSGARRRARGDPREAALNDYENLVQVFELAPPDGYSDMESFNRDLDALLTQMHRGVREFPAQSVRGGTQSIDYVIGAGHDLVQRLRARFDEALDTYIQSMKDDPEHRLFARRTPTFHYASSWSTRLSDGGHHVNHIHSGGWISAAYYVSVPQGEGGVLQFGEPPFEAGIKNPVRRTRSAQSRNAGALSRPICGTARRRSARGGTAHHHRLRRGAEVSIASGLSREPVMSWMVLAAIAVAGTFATFTDWLFMGVLFHARYNSLSRIWWPGPREAAKRRAILYSSALAYLTTAP